MTLVLNYSCDLVQYVDALQNINRLGPVQYKHVVQILEMRSEVNPRLIAQGSGYRGDLILRKFISFLLNGYTLGIPNLDLDALYKI